VNASYAHGFVLICNFICMRIRKETTGSFYFTDRPIFEWGVLQFLRCKSAIFDTTRSTTVHVQPNGAWTSGRGSERPSQVSPLKFGAEVRNFTWRLCSTGSSNGNDHCLTSSTISRGGGENQRIMLRDTIWFLTLTRLSSAEYYVPVCLATAFYTPWECLSPVCGIY